MNKGIENKFYKISFSNSMKMKGIMVLYSFFSRRAPFSFQTSTLLQ
jgi:hypothetical protein